VSVLVMKFKMHCCSVIQVVRCLQSGLCS